ncbi:Crp/Fnr family transcriptional regulator [Actinoallomurus acaciae]|uniref:Crp/Fnr family transcriptional regulator n=1 Tax=Actinoallomurus acaciae TaxID=502577 RepID=A0ABV5YFC0_9ACTN
MPQGNWPKDTFLHRLREPLRTKILQLGVRRTYPPGHVLLRQGTPGESVWVLVDALVKVSAQTQNGREALLAIRVSGDVVGEMGALDGSPRSATVTTCGRAVVFQVRGAVFIDFIRRHPEAALTLSQMAVERLRWANQRRLDFTGYGTDVCLARVLIDLAGRHGTRKDDGLDIGVSLTQTELGGMVGAKEVTVQKALRGLSGLGLVQPGHRHVLITDMRGLVRFADLDPRDVPPKPY